MEENITTTQETFHTEDIDLPSRGWFYSSNHPLSSGKITLRYMTARDEDILTSTNLIQKGTVLDKLMQSLIVNKNIAYKDILIGDKNAIMIASRILGYGRKYDVNVKCPQCNKSNEVVVDLQDLKDKEIEFDPNKKGRNEFSFELPMTKKKIIFRLLTHGDEEAIEAEIEADRRIGKDAVSTQVTTRMRKSIISIDGNRDFSYIRKEIDSMPSIDAMEFRTYAKKINPDTDLSFDFSCNFCGHDAKMEVPIELNFFWPNTRI